MGALQEEQRSVYNKGLEIKGAIDILLALQQKEAQTLKESKTAGLILPEGVKPVVSQESSDPAVEPGKPVDAQVPAAPALEVK
jgi:hypothetical protein